MSFTPGPWKVETENDGSWEQHLPDYVRGVMAADGRWVVRFDDDYGTEQGADARLIAAAPDLLVALKRAYEFLGMIHLPDQESSVPGRTTCPVCVSLDIVSAAIAKATGTEATDAG